MGIACNGRSRIAHHPVSRSLWRTERHVWTPWQHNQTLDESVTIACKLLQSGLAAWRLSRLYIEFANLADPEDVVDAPAVAADGGLSYFNSLGDSSDRDYLSIAIKANSLDSSDDTRFPLGNRLKLFGQTTGTTGVHGKPFSAASNSKIYGVAAVASPVANDSSQDMVWGRSYYSEGDQLLKLAGIQIDVEYEILFGGPPT